MAGYNYFPATYQPNYYGGMYNPQPQVPQIPTPAQAPQQAPKRGLRMAYRPRKQSDVLRGNDPSCYCHQNKGAVPA